MNWCDQLNTAITHACRYEYLAVFRTSERFFVLEKRCGCLELFWLEFQRDLVIEMQAVLGCSDIYINKNNLIAMYDLYNVEYDHIKHRLRVIVCICCCDRCLFLGCLNLLGLGGAGHRPGDLFTWFDDMTGTTWLANAHPVSILSVLTLQ